MTSIPGFSAANSLISEGRSFLTWPAANNMPWMHTMRVAPRPLPSHNGTLRERQEKLMPLLRQVAAEAYQLSLSPSQVKPLLHRVIKELDGK